MNLKRISEFALSMLLSLSSLLVIAVPKAHATTSSWNGVVVDNNLNLALHTPVNSLLIILSGSMLAAGATLAITKKYNRVSSRR